MPELKTTFVQNLPEERGQGKNGEWVKNSFVTESTGQYPKKAAFTIWGDKSSLVKNLRPGQEITVKFDLESREYNGRWFTEAKAFAVETAAVVADQSSREPMPNTAPVQDDLPF
jgi:hypothetical protein